MSSSRASRWNRLAASAASFVAFAGFTLVMPFLPLYFRELGVTDVSAIALWSGVSLGITPAMTAVLAPLWGRLADRFGLKIMVERSLISFVIIMAATAYATHAWHVFALRTIQGLFAGFGALTVTMAAESARRDDLAASIGSVQIAQRLGPALGPVIGGVLAQLVGLRRAFLVAAGFYAVAFLLVLLLYHEELPAARRGDEHASTRVTIHSVLRLPNFLLLMVAVFLLQYLDRTFGPILPLYVAQLGTPLERVPLVAGVIYSIAAGSAALGHHQSRRLLSRAPARVVIIAGAATSGCGMLVVGLSPAVSLLMVGTAVFGVAMGVAMTAVYAVGGSVMPPGARGVGFGVLTTASLSGIALSPVFSGMLGAASLRGVFLLNAVVMGGLAWIVARWMAAARGGAGSRPH